ncbi:MAG TPA: hypothetical protein VF938_00820 [Candidatus Angelobacter sp.]
MIADIARHRRNRKGKNIPRISADARGSGKSLTAKDAKSAKEGSEEIAKNAKIAKNRRN